jgi:glutamate-ammonia-ligase adenylyltransferase
MPDLAKLESELIVRYPAPWVRHHLATFPDGYFETFDETAIGRHVGAMMDLTDTRSVRVLAEAQGEGVWRIDVVGYDAFQFLSTLCTLLAVRGLAILEGQVFTSQFVGPEVVNSAARRGPQPRRLHRREACAGPDRRPRIVDVFRVRPVRVENGSPDWNDFEAELSTLALLLHNDQYEQVHHRLIRPFVAALGPYRTALDGLEPIDLTLDVEDSETATAVRIRAQDSFGFLSLTASALALCGIRIIQALVRTDQDRVDDILWVTDRWGQKIVSEPKLRELRLSLILIEHFSSRLPRATDPEAALIHFSRFARETMARPDWAREFEALERPEVLEALVRVLGESHFLWEEYLHAQPEIVLPMINDPTEWKRPPGRERLAAELESSLAAAGPEQWSRAIRQYRDREIFRADLRTILGLSQGLDQFSAELSDLAEVVLRSAYILALRETMASRQGRTIGLVPGSVLCALGKFGGRELGFASDLEVMIIYDDRGGSPRTHDRRVGAFFDHVVATLGDVLKSKENRAFNLDFRLRPYGRAGAPATSLSSFLDYYRAGGSAWGYERQALIKLRVLTDDHALGCEVETHRDRFVYGPEPFDLGGFQRMRRLQIEQLVQPGTVNAKFSPGALVDVEYFVQALQIRHGGQDASFRTPNTLGALAALGAAGLLAQEHAHGLRSSYRFFRMLIDAMRVVRGNAKDVTLPPPGSDEFTLLARRMRAPEPDFLRAELDRRLEQTRRLTETLHHGDS